MESICKIVIIILFGFFFTHAIECVGQNIYDSKTIYYNMDTLRCVDNDIRLVEGNKLISNSDNLDSAWLYCTLNTHIDIPIVTINDNNLIHILDSCLFEASKWNYLQFPDSSGFFVELLIFDKTDDSLKLGLSINPISNYYMTETLLSFRNEAYNEWYGYNEKNIQGCFFLDNILFVIISFGWVDYDRASCLFPQTSSTIRLSLYSPIRSLLRHDIWFKEYYFFQKCVHK